MIEGNVVSTEIANNDTDGGEFDLDLKIKHHSYITLGAIFCLYLPQRV